MSFQYVASESYGKISIAPQAVTPAVSVPKNAYVHWTSNDGTHFWPANPTVGKLSRGVYDICRCEAGLFFQLIPVKTDGLLNFPDTASGKVLAEIQKFWEREDVFKEYSLAYKRGILLYGPPGTGKSSTIQLLMHDVVQRDGIVIRFNHPSLFIEGMRALRQIEPETPVVVIMEDVDSIMDAFSQSEILNILDGINDVHKVVFIATTNYPERLGERIINRPSRFDKRFAIGWPSKDARRMYFEFLIGGGDKQRLEAKLEVLDINLDKWVKDTNEMSLAHLKELFIQVVIIGDSYKEAITNLRGMSERVKGVEEASFGFAPESCRGN